MWGPPGMWFEVVSLQPSPWQLFCGHNAESVLSQVMVAVAEAVGSAAAMVVEV